MRCALLLLTALLLSCESPDELLPLVEHTPLELDPTETYTLAPWWTDGRQLLHLADDGAYALYEDANRYRPPSARGRWSQGSYAVLWLEPYDSRRPTRQRVAIGRLESEIVLVMPGSRHAMLALEAPPQVLEDHLIGEWTAPQGQLVLRSSMAYSFAPAPRPLDAPVVVAGHAGRWEVAPEGAAIVLRPHPPADALHLRIESAGETIRLIDGGAAFERRPDS